MEKEVARKCCVCKKQIDITKDGFVPERYGKNIRFKYYHKNCFTDKMRSNGLSDNEIKDVIEKNTSYYNDKKLVPKDDTKRKTYSSVDKDKLVYFLWDMYGLTSFSRYFYIYLDEIMSGTHRKTSRAIPPEDLLDMWIQKKSYLERVYDNNVKKGNNMSGENRIKYDMAILISKYDKYLEWKNKKAEAESEKSNMSHNKIDINCVKASHSGKTIIDIASILDEI